MSSPVDHRPSNREVLGHRGIRPLIGMQFLSACATVMQVTAVGALVYDITGRELDLGLLGLAEFMPSLVLMLVTGVVADRYDRRRVARLAFAGELVCAALLAWYATTSPTAVGPIFAIVAAYGVARAFMAPAARSLPANLAPPGGLSRLVGMSSTAWQLSTIVGPALAGVLYAWDVRIPFVVVSTLVACGLGLTFVLPDVRSVPAIAETTPYEGADPDCATVSDRDAKPVGGAALVKSAFEGLTLVRRTPILLGAISLDLFAVLFGGAVALIPAIVTDRLHMGHAAQGWLRASGGVGASIMALVLIARPVVRHVGRVLMASVAVFGLATIVFGVTRSFVVAMACMVILQAADMVSVFIRSTIVPLATPDGTRGRVMAVEQVFIGASNELGAAESGLAASVVGTSGAVAGGGVVTVAIVGLWWVCFPALRDVDRFSDIEHPGNPS